MESTRNQHRPLHCSSRQDSLCLWTILQKAGVYYSEQMLYACLLHLPVQRQVGTFSYTEMCSMNHDLEHLMEIMHVTTQMNLSTHSYVETT